MRVYSHFLALFGEAYRPISRGVVFDVIPVDNEAVTTAICLRSGEIRCIQRSYVCVFFRPRPVIGCFPERGGVFSRDSRFGALRILVGTETRYSEGTVRRSSPGFGEGDFGVGLFAPFVRE